MVYEQKQTESYVDLVKILKDLWSKIVPILLVGFMVGAIFFSYAKFFITPTYEANALFYVNNSSFSLSSAVAITTGELSAASDLVDTYVAILQSRANMELVLEKSGVHYTYEQLREMISAKAVNSTGLFQITVTSTSPEEARTLANTIAAILPDKVSDIVANSSIELVDYAVTPHQRVAPSYIKYAVLGVFFGMVLASCVVLFRSYSDDLIHDEDYLIQTYSRPILASIPNLAEKPKTKAKT